MTEATPAERIDNLETSNASCITSLAYLRWICSAGITAFIVVAGLAYAKSERAGVELSTQAQVRFATHDEQYKQIQKDLKALDTKIDDRFSQIRESLKELKQGK